MHILIHIVLSKRFPFSGFMQFVVKDIADGQTALLDNALRMVSQLLTAWKNAAGDIKSVFERTK